MITRNDIINIARLSKLHVEDSEIDSLTSDMKKIIGFADEISRAQEENSEENSFDEELCNVLREDEVKKSFSQNLILKNVNGGKDGFFCIKKHKN